MKLIVSILLSALLAFVAGLYFPWWAFAVAVFAVGALIPQQPFKSFLSGFTGVFLLWLALLLFLNGSNNGVMADRVGNILSVKGGAAVLIPVTCLLGGLIGGLAALSGAYLRKR